MLQFYAQKSDNIQVPQNWLLLDRNKFCEWIFLVLTNVECSIIKFLQLPSVSQECAKPSTAFNCFILYSVIFLLLLVWAAQQSLGARAFIRDFLCVVFVFCLSVLCNTVLHMNFCSTLKLVPTGTCKNSGKIYFFMKQVLQL